MDATRREIAALSAMAGAAAALQGGTATAQTSAGLVRARSDAELDAALAPSGTFRGNAHEIIPLWRGAAPGAPSSPPSQTVIDRSGSGGPTDRAVTHVSRPVLVVFRPDAPNGASVLIAPGGGYERVVLEKEGYEMAAWLNERGVTAFVMIYRLPGDGWAAGADVSLQDAQRAMRVIRARAGAYRVDANRVAAMGYSAGGHVIGSLAERYDAAVHAPLDDIDALPARPDAALLIYPVATMEAAFVHEGSRRNLLGQNPSAARMQAYSLEHGVRADMPPVFLLHANDDTAVPVANALALQAALSARGLAPEAHYFAEGGHGFGLRLAQGKPVGIWPELALNWLRARGVAPQTG